MYCASPDSSRRFKFTSGRRMLRTLREVRGRVCKRRLKRKWRSYRWTKPLKMAVLTHTFDVDLFINTYRWKIRKICSAKRKASKMWRWSCWLCSTWQWRTLVGLDGVSSSMFGPLCWVFRYTLPTQKAWPYLHLLIKCARYGKLGLHLVCSWSAALLTRGSYSWVVRKKLAHSLPWNFSYVVRQLGYHVLVGRLVAQRRHGSLLWVHYVGNIEAWILFLK